MKSLHLFSVRLACLLSCLLLSFSAIGLGCSDGSTTGPQSSTCKLVEEGFGDLGKVRVKAETVVSGLKVPWSFAFLPNGWLLITEREGKLRLAIDGKLSKDPVLKIDIGPTNEGGLLGLALHPKFDLQTNPLIYLYYTVEKGSKSVNQVAIYRLASDAKTAKLEKVILDDIPASQFHNGGRITFGPDGNLYIGTGDARVPDLSQDKSSLAGKLLRIRPDGTIPDDNPFPNSPVFVLGLRNTQGFVWKDPSNLWITDHGPSGDLGRRGHDEISYAQAGSNLGWPTVYGCQTQDGFVSPSLTWKTAVPPGGAAIYTGDKIPEWKGSVIIGSLGARHLHVVQFKADNPNQIEKHEVYFDQEPPTGLGRIRDVQMGADGHLYATTSNCDGRGSCGSDKDKIVRILPE